MSPLLSSSTLSSSASSATPASSATVITESAGMLAWKTAVYLVVVAIIVAIIAGIIIFIGRVDRDWAIPSRTRQLTKMESKAPDSTSYSLPSAFTLVRGMLHYFFTTLWPTFRHLRQATASSLYSTMGLGQPRLQHALPLFRTQGLPEPLLTPPHPVVPRDNSSLRISSNPSSCSYNPPLPTLAPSMAYYPSSAQ